MCNNKKIDQNYLFCSFWATFPGWKGLFRPKTCNVNMSVTHKTHHWMCDHFAHGKCRPCQRLHIDIQAFKECSSVNDMMQSQAHSSLLWCTWFSTFKAHHYGKNKTVCQGIQQPSSDLRSTALACQRRYETADKKSRKDLTPPDILCVYGWQSDDLCWNAACLQTQHYDIILLCKDVDAYNRRSSCSVSYKSICPFPHLINAICESI